MCLFAELEITMTVVDGGSKADSCNNLQGWRRLGHKPKHAFENLPPNSDYVELSSSSLATFTLGCFQCSEIGEEI